MSQTVTTAEELSRATSHSRCELLRGRVFPMVPSRGEHGRVVVRATVPLASHVMARGLGIVYGAETGFLLSRNPDTVRAPDVAFVRAERAAAHSAGYLAGAPDLAVEVLSPDDRPDYVSEKVAEWLAGGARAVWIIDPEARTVTVHEIGGAPLLLSVDGVLRGGAALPGFSMPVHDLFG
ncbi:MAG: Uma2 family endonuclease [Planctomycetaceae bacterium]